jgi:D-amino peptidase
MSCAQGFRHVLIVADIEGSSGCWNYAGSAFMTRAWVNACENMTADVSAVATALLEAGVRSVTVKDFHRTGYNLLAERLPDAVELISGYHADPVPGMGDPRPAEAVMFLGLHAASGTEGFLSHTLTSRLADIRINDRPLPEVQLFAASLAPLGLAPLYFSGCPEACRQAKAVIPGITTHAIDKSGGPEKFDAAAWRRGLAAAAVASLYRPVPALILPDSPLQVVITFRDGPPAAAEVARRWGYACDHDQPMSTHG